MIRGTILSDVQVEGDYRTLDLLRPGNVIDVEDFDGIWATVTISTRKGNRDGDNVRARMILRDADLRTIGIDCEKILTGAGLVIEAELEPEPPPAPMPSSNGYHSTNGVSNGTSNGAVNGAHVFVDAPEPEPPPAPVREEFFPIWPVDHAPEPPAEPVVDEPAFDEPAAEEPVLAEAPVAVLEREPEPVPDPEPPAPELHPDPAPEPPPRRASRPGRTNLTDWTFTFGKTSIDGKILIEVGGAIVSVALPVVLYFLRQMFKKKGPPGP